MIIKLDTPANFTVLPSAMVDHYFGDGVLAPWDFGDGSSFTMGVTAKTEQKLFTGGKAGVARRNLFQLHAGATEILRPPVATSEYGWGIPWWSVSVQGVDPTKTLVAGKTLGADNNLWLMLPDNSPGLDVTVKAPGIHHYDASITQQKYKLRIVVNGSNPLWPDHVPSYNNYCVGQYLGFDQEFTPALPEIPQYSPIQWVLDGTYVNTNIPPASSDGSGYYTNEPALLKNQTTSAWWIDGKQNPPDFKASLGEGMTFANGQYVVINTRGLFSIYRPKYEGFETNPPYTAYIEQKNDYLGLTHYLLSLGTNGDVGWMDFSVKISCNPNFGGDLNWTQLISRNAQNDSDTFSTYGDEYWHDNSGFYNDANDPVGHYPPYPNISATPRLLDSPGVDCGKFSTHCYCIDSFKSYLVFKPVGDSRNIWVTLRLVTWGWAAQAQRSSVLSDWQIVSGSFHLQQPSDVDSTQLPTWPHTYLNSHQ
jgi:hypothetical protein